MYFNEIEFEISYSEEMGKDHIVPIFVLTRHLDKSMVVKICLQAGMYYSAYLEWTPSLDKFSITLKKSFLVCILIFYI